MEKGRPVPRDLLFFLREEVFPHVPRAVIESALSCATVRLASEGEELVEPGLYVVYSGAVRFGGVVHERGDYFVLDRGSKAIAVSESIILVIELRCGGDLLRFVSPEACRVGDLLYRSPVTVEPTASVLDAVRVMYEAGVSSVVVVDDERRVLGIFTDTDLRRLIATGQDLSKPISLYMTSNPFSMPASAACVDAVYQMMERNIKHLIVTDRDGRLLGIVTIRDIAYAESLGPLYVRRVVKAAGTVDELREAYLRLVRVLAQFGRKLHPLVAGGSVVSLVRMASLALRTVVSRAAMLAAKRLGVGLEGWAYIVMGSNARLEQASPTDRDTALVYVGFGEATARRLAEEIEGILDAIGFPGCEHGYTARDLVYSLDELLELLSHAAASPTGDKEIVLVGLFSDAVEAYPEASLGFGERIRRAISDAVREGGSGPYLKSVLAAYRPKFRPLGRLPSRVDLKKHGLAPIVFAAKALAVSSGLWEPVATVDRLEALSARGVLPGDTAREAVEAYHILLGFASWSQAVHGARELNVDELSGVERNMLRSALQAAAKLVDRVRGVV